MTTTVTRQIDWDSILKGYGPETQEALRALLREHDVPEDDPAAVVIAAQFISQIETTRAFAGLSDTLEEGRTHLSDEFKVHVEQLRGIISFAQEHLVETGREDVEKRQQELLDAVRQGVSKAISSGNARFHSRNVAHTVSLIASTGAISLSCLVGGSLMTFALVNRSTSPEPPEIENAALWRAIAEQNQEVLKTCQVEIVELKRQCVITLP